MAPTRTTRRAVIASAAAALLTLTGCTATQKQQPVSDAAWNAPTFTVATADGFVVGDALGMTLLAGSDVRLADVNEAFELTD